MIKKIRTIIIILCFITVGSCKNKKSKIDKVLKTEFNEKKLDINSGFNTVDKEIIKTNNDSHTSTLIDLNKELKLEWGNYIIRFNDSILSLCNEQNLYNPFMSFEREEISKYLTNYKIKIDTTDIYKKVIFSKEDSFVTISNWRSEENGNIEIYLGKGILKDTSVTLPRGIKIGMKKEKFLSKYFITPNYIINELKLVSVCPDERGETYTKYYFDDDKLSRIEF